MKSQRILAIDPIRSGFGFVVFEDLTPIDWGTCSRRPQNTALNRFAELVRRFRPDILLIEDYTATESQRSAGVKQLLESIEVQAATARLPSRRIAVRTIQRRFLPLGAGTKWQRAQKIAARFPDLAPHLPPVRRPWMSEDERMSIFDAAALVVCHRRSCPIANFAADGK